MSLILIVFYSMWGWSAQVELQCDDQGHLISFKYGKEAIFDSKNAASTPTKKESFEMSYPYKGYSRIQLGPSGKANMESAKYLKVAELAIKQGIDPFLAMGVLSVEKTPLKKNSPVVDSYLNAYGAFPVDGRPAYSALKCSIEKPYMKSFWKGPGKSIVQHKSKIAGARKRYDSSTRKLFSKFNRLSHLGDALRLRINLKHGLVSAEKKLGVVLAEQREIEKKYSVALRDLKKSLPKASTPHEGLLIQQVARCGSKCHGLVLGNCSDNDCKKMPTIDLSSEKETKFQTLCKKQGAQPNSYGDPPSFSTYSSGSKNSCCYKLKINKSDKPLGRRDALGALGLDIFWNKRVPFAMKKVGTRKTGKLTSDDLHKLSRIVQIWNGWGRMNVTEEIGSCLGQLNMRTNPAIGGKALDLTTNSIMNNKFLVANVQAMGRKFNKPIKSIYCKYSGAGKKKFDSKKISQLINGRYLNSTKCSGRSKRRRRGGAR